MPDHKSALYWKRAQAWREMVENARTDDERAALLAIADGYAELSEIYAKIAFLQSGEKPH